MDIRIQDDAPLFDGADMHRITSERLPFELHVLTTSAPSRAALEARVHDAIDGPDVVAIGVDPTHHWVVAHFGTGTGVPSSQWNAIVTSGNRELHDARWADGVLAIARTAAHARTESSVTIAERDDASSGAGVFIAGGFVLVVVLLLGVLWWRKRPSDAVLREAWASGGPYRSPGRAPRYAKPVAPSSSNDLLTGYVIGSAMQPSPTVTHTAPTFDVGSSFGGGGFGGGGFDGGGFDGGGSSSF